MKILQYVSQLIPSFGRDRVLDEITRLNSAVTGTLMPALRQAQKSFQHDAVDSDLAKRLQGELRSVFPEFAHSDLFDILVNLFRSVPGQLDVLEHFVEQHFAKDQTKEAITYRRATVLQYLDTLTFAVEFATNWTVRVVAAEAALAAKEPERTDAYLTPRQKEEFDSLKTDWFAALKVVYQDPKVLLSAIEHVPDAVVSETNDAAVAATRSIDPLKMNFIRPRFNLLYRLGMMKAEWDVARIQRSKEEKQLMELRLHELTLARTGATNPRLEHQIKLVTDRLNKINFRIRRLSDDV